MPRMLVALLGLGLLIGSLGCSPAESQAPSDRDPERAPRFSVLVFSKTDGYRHQSIPAGIRAIEELGRAHRFPVAATEDAAVFTSDTLRSYDVVVFLNTSGNVLNEAQQVAFKRFIQAGGGFVGVHAASDTEHEWPWYGRLVGAYFEDHPPVQKAVVRVVDSTHAATRFLPNHWPHTDEWYNYEKNPRENGVQVLLIVGESTYEGGKMGTDHPVAWMHSYDGGRAFYTVLGHTKESYTEDLFRKHLLGGIEWAAGLPIAQ